MINLYSEPVEPPIIEDSITQEDIIIEEELPAFFEGKKSAKDIAEILQSRVNLYLNEIK